MGTEPVGLEEVRLVFGTWTVAGTDNYRFLNEQMTDQTLRFHHRSLNKGLHQVDRSFSINWTFNCAYTKNVSDGKEEPFENDTRSGLTKNPPRQLCDRHW